MTLLIADINDACITLISKNGTLYNEPGYALLDDVTLSTGSAAYRMSRLRPRHINAQFWSGLSVDSLPDTRFRHLSAADLVSRQLEQMWQAAPADADRVVIAVPAYMGAEQLGLLLGICNELKLPVAALVDAAVAATRREYVNARPVHIDFSLHTCLLTRMSQAENARVEKAAMVEDAGLVALHDTWIRTVSELFVRQSRFDPLHTADTEQQLLEHLPGWLRVATGGGTVVADLEAAGTTHSAEIEALALVAAAAPHYQRIISQLRTLVRADETPALQLSDRAAQMPGFADMLKARVGGEVFLLEPGATARGLLGRCRDITVGDGPVSLIRQLPWDQAAVAFELAADNDGGGRPSHVLYDNTAYLLDSEVLNFGTRALPGERWVGLPDSMPGISRKHCAMKIDGGQCVVQDFSRYGTFLNGHRIDGSAVLQVGDLLRIGTPGFELRMITTGDARGT
ncbi:MAG TPA: FHA domain-containing protein [Woeseiaceae bacterium]|nr:FHA domain-containing protein [Woeseiaceae bacterium]